jgi:hypothetical protein
VITRGLEMIFPRPSAWSAESSRLRKRVPRLLKSRKEKSPGCAPPIVCAGRFTLSESGMKLCG